MTVRYAVVGSPVAHSLSPAIQQAAFDHVGVDARYEALEVDAAGLDEVFRKLRDGQLAGANVTMPSKHRAYQEADEVEGDARRAESVNTLVPAQGSIRGISTDIPAIRRVWEERELPVGSVLILGGGGAAAAALVALKGNEIFLATRTNTAAQSLLERLQIEGEVVPWAGPVPGAVIVNATPMGMRGETLPAGILSQSSGLFDMAYGSLPTPSIVAARGLGLPTAEGLDMLVEQAALSFEAWTEHSAPRKEMRAAAQIAQGW